MNCSATGDTLRVPAGCKAAYEADTDWRDTFTSITKMNRPTRLIIDPSRQEMAPVGTNYFTHCIAANLPLPKLAGYSKAGQKNLRTFVQYDPSCISSRLL